MSVINPHAAGIDVGAQFHVVAVGPECTSEPVRSFRSFTTDLHELARWLRHVKVTTVVRESTGIYWLPVFEILESYGFEVLLANAREAKSVPGRKTDVNDAQWLQKLHRYGLLRASFRPRQDVATLRSYLRQRERLLEYAASHIQHMQKALMQMNVQLHHVVQDITGVTGMKIIRAIVAGERNTDLLAQHRDRRCKSSVETIREALAGHYQPEHVFELTQAVALYDFYQTQVAQCDQRIEVALRQLQTDVEPITVPLPGARHRGKQSNDFPFDVRAALYGMLGVDLTQVHGLGPYTALKLIAECGNDMSRWPTVKHFTSWLCLAPGNKISGGKILSSKTRRSSSKVAAALRLAAVAIGKTDTALGGFYRRLSARIGKAKAVSRRVMHALQEQGIRIGRYRVRTVMREAGLRTSWKRKFVSTTDSRHTLPVAENVLDRQFEVAKPNRAWVSDITYIRTAQGWLYLAVVLDLYSRRVVGWSMAPTMPTGLVMSALTMALQQRRPAPGLVLHSDRGSQYASDEYQTLLKQHRVVCSMSRKGNCWDNSVMERFFLNLKMERVWQRQYANHDEARRDINQYIVAFYNPVRLHSTLGYLSPAAYEANPTAKEPIRLSEIS